MEYNILYVMIPVSVLLGSVFLALFILATKKGQFEDLETPAYKILIEEKLYGKKSDNEGRS